MFFRLLPVDSNLLDRERLISPCELTGFIYLLEFLRYLFTYGRIAFMCLLSFYFNYLERISYQLVYFWRDLGKFSREIEPQFYPVYILYIQAVWIL